MSRLLPSNIVLIGIFSIVIISGFSFGLFFYLQEITLGTSKSSLFDQQETRQVDMTDRLSGHIGSDLDLILSTLDGLATSSFLQAGDMHSEGSRALVQEKYDLLNPRVNRLVVLDKNNVVTMSFAPSSLETFLSADLSLREWVAETRSTQRPVFAEGFERQGMYRIFISYPIVERTTQEFLGIILVSIPTRPFFAHYANVEDIGTQFLVVFDDEGTIIADGESPDLVGKNFFDEEVQASINYHPVLNDLTRSLLSGQHGSAVHERGGGERITTQSPIYVQGEALYFVQLVTPTTEIYSEINESLQAERTKLFLLLSATLAAVVILVVFLVKWNRTLGQEVDNRTKELQEANERLHLNLTMQREFLNIAAHELRTPVQPILGLAQVINEMGSREIGGSKYAQTESEKELLGIILRNAKRLEKLIEDLLDVSKIEAQSLRLRKETLSLNQIIAVSINDFGSSVQKAPGVKVVCTPFEETHVQADKERIAQVLSNLIGNSLKFTTEGQVALSAERHDGKIIVTVRDDGKGIERDLLPKLFTKFVSRSEKGTGLGLFISKGIVEAHGGEIWAENNSSGRGASLHFSLPVAQE